MLTKPSMMKIATLTLSALLLLSLLAAALPRPAAAAAPTATCARTHVVKEGETIRRIARTYEMTVYRLARANDLAFPYALTVGQSLCIPESASLSSNVKYTITNKDNKIKIEGTGFKKQNPFYIKVRENDTSAWYKLGLTQTDRDGDLSATFNVPKDLQKKPSLIVCLKDGVTDALACRQSFRQ
jgi:hypothetical protein